MSNRKTTKRALMTSVLAIFMCLTMLVGTTFAWFTDTASTGVNTIQAGTLDVVLEMFENDEWVSAEGKTLSFTENYWEPGCTYSLPQLRIRNNGNLALKYKVVITGIKGDAKLNKVIDWTITVGENEESADSERHLTAGSSEVLNISGHMQESAGNEYQGLKIEGISITVYATQDTVESDSTGNPYDQNAQLPSTWNGTSDVAGLAANTDAENKTVKIETAEQLAAFAANVKANNTYFGYTVTLERDIDLSGAAWSGIGADNYSDFPSYFFNGTFDGQGHTIYNMTVSNLGGNTSIAGFFNGLGNNAIVKNLNFENASVTSNHQAGVVAGYCCTAAGNGVVQEPKASIENCHVNNSTVVSKAHKSGNTYDDGDKVGGIIGYTFFTVKDCSVKNTTITGYRDIGGIVGYANANGYSAANVTGNTVENVTIYVDKTHDYKNYTSLSQHDANPIIGEKDATVAETNNEGTATVVTVVDVATNSAEEVAAALKATTETISVTLTGDVALDITTLGTITGGSGQYKLGGADTKKINIDLNGHKLTLNTTYWSALGAKNSNAVITVKNGSMNSTQATGTWNNYDLTFYDCSWNFVNVTFEKAVAISTNTTATMKNVAINDNNDVYALWITADAKAVTLNNVTINCPNGRAIAIKDQYVSSPAKVTLNITNSKFTSAKKAAVLVTSEGGAAITASNVDISNVSADQTNLVWKDNGTKSTGFVYANADVTVSGCTATVEP